TNDRTTCSFVSNTVSSTPASIRRLASRPPTRPTPIKPALRSAIAKLLEHFSRYPETVHRGRHAAIDRDLQKDFHDFVLGHSVYQRSFDMHFELVMAIQRREHCKIQQAARLLIETGTAPDLAPTILRDQFLHRPVEIVGRCKCIIDKVRSKDL